ncbi:MAG: hypothetical protein ACXWE9_05465 [Methylobacter sp.]
MRAICLLLPDPPEQEKLIRIPDYTESLNFNPALYCRGSPIIAIC